MQILSVILLGLFLMLLESPRAVFADGVVVINEFIAHPAPGGKEWVEFYIADNSNINGFWLDDDLDFTNDNGSSSKKLIDTPIQGSDGHHVYVELASSLFNNTGDTVALFAPNGTLIDQTEYGSDPHIDGAIGRSPDGTGSFQLLAESSKGSPNSLPFPTITPTALPTAKPTRMPTATPEPTAIRVRALTATPTLKIIYEPSTTVNSKSPTPKNTYKLDANASNSAYPTAILGAKSVMTDPDLLPKPTIPVIVKSANSSPSILIIFGGIIFLGCALLLYFKKWKIR